MIVENLYMVVENLYMVVENPYMVLGNPYMVVRGRAEYRRSPSGAREMCVPTGPAGEMCVPKPFSCLFVLFCLAALRKKPKTGSAGKQLVF